jgi:hypothetical protein
MEMPGKTINEESKSLLGSLLCKVMDCGTEVPFEELIQKLDALKSDRTHSLDEADERVQRLLKK